MAGSTLTVRTLALATVAFALACGHAVQARAAQKAGTERYKAAPAELPAVRVVPAGSGHSTIATYSNTGGGGRPGGSTVATFTSKSGGSGNSVVTFNGDKTIQVNHPASVASTHPMPPRPPQSKPAAKPGSKSSGDAPMIVVRHTGDPSPLDPKPDEPFMGPPAPPPEPVVAAKPPAPQAPQIRNAFAGLGGVPKSTIEPSAMYARAASNDAH